MTTSKTQDNHAASNATIAKALAADPTITKSANAPGIVLRTSAYQADPSTITRQEGFNPRFDFGEIADLARSIKANGLLMPLRVKRIAGAAKTDAKQFELIDGDRRLTALEQLIKQGSVFEQGVPVIIVDKAQDDMTSLIQMFEANSGKAFLPMEEAAAYKRMRDAGMTLKQIGASVSRNHVHIVATLALLDADDSVTDAVKDGSVKSTVAKKIAVAARGDKAKQKELIAAAKSGGKAAKAAVGKAIHEQRAKVAASKGKTIKMRALSDDELSALGSALAIQLVKLLKDAGLPTDTDLRKWVGMDDKLAVAFTFGALEAMKAAAGVKCDLSI